MKLTSTAFEPNGSMPAKHTCEGSNTSPPLSWSDAPSGTQSFALIVEDPDAPDPDAPTRIVTHWVLFDLPHTTQSIAEGGTDLPAGAKQGLNYRGDAKYMGPCPPIGRHRYFFKLYALDQTIVDLGSPQKAELEKAMRGHVLASSELIGTYQKQAT